MTLCLECCRFMSAPFQKPRITPVDTKGVQELLGNEAKYKATPVNYKNPVSSYIDPCLRKPERGRIFGIWKFFFVRTMQCEWLVRVESWVEKGLGGVVTLAWRLMPWWYVLILSSSIPLSRPQDKSNCWTTQNSDHWMHILLPTFELIRSFLLS